MTPLIKASLETIDRRADSRPRKPLRMGQLVNVTGVAAAYFDGLFHAQSTDSWDGATGDEITHDEIYDHITVYVAAAVNKIRTTANLAAPDVPDVPDFVRSMGPEERLNLAKLGDKQVGIVVDGPITKTSKTLDPKRRQTKIDKLIVFYKVLFDSKLYWMDFDALTDV